MLSVKEQEICKKIFGITEAINDIYQVLFFDEMTADYLTKDNKKIIVDELNQLIKQENKLYEQLEVNLWKASEIIELVEKEYPERVVALNTQVETAIGCDDFDALNAERIIDRIYKRAIGNDKDLGKIMGIFDPHAVPTKRLTEAIISDFERAFLYFNEKLINEESFKIEFLKIKYQLIFISENVEKYFWEANDKEHLYFSYPLIAEYYQIPTEVMYNYVTNYGIDFSEKAINTLICNNDEINDNFEFDEENDMSYEENDMSYEEDNEEISREDENDDIEEEILYNESTKKIFRTFLKAGLSLIVNTPCYDEQLNSLNDALNELDEESQSMMSESLNSIVDTITEIDKEKEKCKYLYFKM